MALVGDFVLVMGKQSYVALKVCRKYRLILLINLVWGRFAWRSDVLSISACFLVVAANLLQMNEKYEITGYVVSFAFVEGILQNTCEKRLFALSCLSVVCL